MNWLYTKAPEWVWQLYLGLIRLVFIVIAGLMVAGTLLLILPVQK